MESEIKEHYTIDKNNNDQRSFNKNTECYKILFKNKKLKME